MKLSKKQQLDLDTVFFFMPKNIDKSIVSETDVRTFFEYSEQGKHKDKIKNYTIDGFNSLLQGKRWRGIHIHEMYEPGILSGDVPYIVLLEDMPRSVVDFLKKEMFKGEDSELIEKIYINYGK